MFNVNRIKVKVCGITNLEDLKKVVYYGADAAGFVFYKKSPRYVSPSKAKKLVEELPPFVTPVGIFVNLKERAIRDICKFTGINTVQLHGDEDPLFCARLKKQYNVIKAFRVADDFNFKKTKQYNVDAFLFDAYKEGVEGGTGEVFNWKIMRFEKFDKPFILSGGLNAENIKDATEVLSPYAVDVSSGVEKSPGIKSPQLIRAFFDSLDQSSIS